MYRESDFCMLFQKMIQYLTDPSHDISACNENVANGPKLLVGPVFITVMQ